MARINLLPWRAERRTQRQRDFYAMLGLAALAGAVLSFLLWFHYDSQISGQRVRNDYLNGEIQKVDAQITEIEALDKQKDRLLARKKVIEQLQANRSQMVHLFDSLVRTIPDGVALSNIKQEGEVLTLEGRAQSNARVSAYMRNLESSGWMTRPELSIIEAKGSDAKTPATSGPTSSLPYVFNLQVRLANPNASDVDPATGAPVMPEGGTPAITTPQEGITPPAAAPAPVATPAPASGTPADPAVSATSSGSQS